MLPRVSMNHLGSERAKMGSSIRFFLSVVSMILPCAFGTSWSPPPCACATANVNIRSGPGLSYSKLGILGVGSCLEYTRSDKFSSNSAWYRVRYHYQNAWVSANFVKLDCNARSTKCVCAKSNVNIRSGPGYDNSIVGSMNTGACQRAGQYILTGNGRWTSVKHNNQYAFIASEFLTVRDCPKTPLPVPNQCVCATGNVNIRSGPGFHHGIVGVLYTGSCHHYFGRQVTAGNQNWAYIQYNGKDAYIVSSYLRTQSCDAVQPQVQKQCVCAKSNVNIRSGPGLYYSILGVLYTGSCQRGSQEISTLNGRWTPVTHNGQNAYIASQFLNRQSCSKPKPQTTGQCACGLTNVKVQSRPSLASTVLGTLQSGGCLPYVGQRNGQGYSRWVIVRVDLTNAYIPASYLSRRPCTASMKGSLY